MKAKALMLGTAAALVMSANAQAADLPAAAPAEYVKVCDAFGTGFFYIPGTDTCLKIDGFVRNDYFMHESKWNNARPLFSNSIVAKNSNNDTVSMRIRGQLGFDARTQTDYGPVRAYVRFRTENRSDRNADNMYAYYAFVQFAGITAGYAQSFWDFFPVNGIMSNYLHSDIITPLLAYTYTAPGGFYATLSLEDNNYSSGDSLATGLNVVNNNWAHSRQDAPALVGAVGVSQSWGKAHLAGVVGQSEFRNTATGVSEQDVFWGVKAGLAVNANLGGVKPTEFGITGAYGSNASRYVSTGGPATAYIDGTAGVDSIENVDSWSVSAGFRHWWTPNLRSTIMGHYAAFDFKDAYQVANGSTDSLVFATANLIWSPVSKMDIGLELIYGSKETTAATTRLSDTEDAFGGMFRIQRDF